MKNGTPIFAGLLYVKVNASFVLLNRLCSLGVGFSPCNSLCMLIYDSVLLYLYSSYVCGRKYVSMLFIHHVKLWHIALDVVIF